MLGLQDIWVAGAFWLCLLSTTICVVYGALNWHRGSETEPDAEDKHWVEDENKLEDEF